MMFAMTRKTFAGGASPALAVALTLGFAFPAVAIDGKPAVDKQTVVAAITALPANLDPLIPPSIESAKYAWNAFDSLYGFDRQGNLEPRLATGYDIGGDGLVWTFKLRKGVKFHNGDDLTAEDVKFSMDRVLQPETKSTRRPFFAPVVESTTVKDAHTVVFRLKKKDGAFLNKLAGYLYVVPHKLVQSLPNADAFAQAPVGTGPWKVVRNQVGRELVFERFDGFWGKKPAVSRLIYKVVPEASSRASALLAGEVDLATEVVPTDLERLQSNKGLAAEVVDGGSPLHIRIYSNDPATPLSKKEVRLAMNYAVDKKALIASVLRGQAVELNSLIPSSYPYGSNPTLKPFEFDVAKAKQLLAQAGYAKGFDTSLTCPSNQPRVICETLAAYWGQVGIRTQIKVIDSVAYNRLNNTHQSGPLVVMGFGNAIYDPIHVIGGAATKDGTWSDYSNPDVDRLVAQVDGEAERAKRAAIFRQVLQITRDDGQAVLLAEPKLIYVKDPQLDWKPQVAGWSLNFREAAWK